MGEAVAALLVLLVIVFSVGMLSGPARKRSLGGDVYGSGEGYKAALKGQPLSPVGLEQSADEMIAPSQKILPKDQASSKNALGGQLDAGRSSSRREAANL